MIAFRSFSTSRARPSRNGLARNKRRPFAAAMCTLICAASVVACSVLLDWNGYSDAGSSQGDSSSEAPESQHVDAKAEAQSEADAGMDSTLTSVTLTSCGTDKLCSPPVPAGAQGWSGPFALFSGPPGAVPSSCDSTVYAPSPAFTGNQGLVAPPAQCACTCGTPQGRACSAPSLAFSPAGDPTCATNCNVSGLPATLSLDGGCVVVPPTCPNFAVGSSVPAGGECVPDGSAVVPTAAWLTAAVACSPTQANAGSCAADELCLPSTAPFCIMHPDAVPCPSGEYYVAQHVFYSGVDDSRGCPGCSCDAPTSGSCSVVAAGPGILDASGPPGILYLDTSCITPTGVFFVPGKCGSLPTAKSFRLNAATTLDPGSCAPSASTPTGTAAATKPTTFCCTN